MLKDCCRLFLELSIGSRDPLGSEIGDVSNNGIKRSRNTHCLSRSCTSYGSIPSSPKRARSSRVNAAPYWEVSEDIQ